MQTLTQNDTTRTEENRGKPRGAAAIDRKTLRSHVGGHTKEIADLQCTLAEAVGELNQLRSLDVIRDLDSQWRIQNRLAATLLEVFRVTVGLRESFEVLERLAEDEPSATGSNAQAPSQSSFDVARVRDCLDDIVHVVRQHADRIPSISDAASLQAETANAVGDALFALSALDSERRGTHANG